MTPQTKTRITDALKRAHAAKYPQVPEKYFPQFKVSENGANELTKAVISFLKAEGHQAERISTTGRYVEDKKQYTDVLGNTRTIGSGRWIKGSGTVGSADISSTIQGVAVKWEVKYGKDRQSDEQKAYQANVEQAGGYYIIVRDLDGFLTQYDNIMEQLTAAMIDRMILTLWRCPVGVYPLTPRQLQIVKAGWRALHDFDKEHEYTLSEAGDKVRKEVRG
jgi:hypothetical protein